MRSHHVRVEMMVPNQKMMPNECICGKPVEWHSLSKGKLGRLQPSEDVSTRYQKYKKNSQYSKVGEDARFQL